MQQNTKIPLLTNAIQLAAKTDTGIVRQANEDNYIVCPDLQKGDWFLTSEPIELTQAGSLLVVADGMGGLNAGEIASAIAVESIKRYFTDAFPDKMNSLKDIQQYLIQSVLYAHECIVTHSKFHHETKGMGTTIVMAYIRDGLLHTAWAGDSRCYVLRNNRLLYQATKDHSYVQTLVDEGKITLEQAFYHPEGNIIIQSLGDTGKKSPVPECNSYVLEKGDRILLCSDGLNGMLMDDAIASLLKEEKDITQCAVRLIKEANNAGGLDNITVILCDIIGEPLCKINEKASLNVLKVPIEIQTGPQQTDFNQTQKVMGSAFKEDNEIPKKKNKKASYIFISIMLLISLSIAFYFFNGISLIEKGNKTIRPVADSLNQVQAKSKSNMDTLRSKENQKTNNSVIESNELQRPRTVPDESKEGKTSGANNRNNNIIENSESKHSLLYTPIPSTETDTSKAIKQTDSTINRED